MTPPTSGNPAPVPSGTQASDRQSGNLNRSKKKKSGSASITSFVGKCAEIKEHVYDVNASRGGSDMLVKTTREIAEYVSSKLKDASEFRNAMDPDNLAFDVLTAPAIADDTNVMEMEIWKIEYKTYSEALKRRELLVGQVFAIVLGQCSPTIVDRLKSSAAWDVVNKQHSVSGKRNKTLPRHSGFRCVLVYIHPPQRWYPNSVPAQWKWPLQTRTSLRHVSCQHHVVYAH
jgi:hypothetical protein